MDNEMRYFSSVEGFAVPRFGFRNAFIGCIKTKRGFEWNPEAIVAIPMIEMRRAGRGYTRAIRQGALKERSAAEYEAHLKKIEKESKRAAEEAEKRQKKAEADAEKLRKQAAKDAAAAQAAVTPVPENDGGDAAEGQEEG